jgi:DNA-binding transcriptional regulator YiaG
MKATLVKKTRARLRWTQKKMAAQLGVTIRTLQNWESKGCRDKSPASQVLASLG